MKQTFFTCAFTLCTIMLFAQTNAADETSIKAVMKQQETAWNKHDWEGFSSRFTEDGTLINLIGQFWTSRKDILAHLKQLNDCCLSATSLTFQVKYTRFLTPDIAIVYIDETLFADRDYEVPIHQYKKGDIEYKMVTNIFVKQNNEWKITAAQVTLINQVVSPHITSAH